MMKKIICDYSIEGKGQTLFLIHGIGAARDAWRFMIPKLKEHFTVISYEFKYLEIHEALVSRVNP